MVNVTPWHGKLVSLDNADTKFVLAVKDEERGFDTLHEFTSIMRAEDAFDVIGGDLYEVELVENVDDIVWWYKMSFLF